VVDEKMKISDVLSDSTKREEFVEAALRMDLVDFADKMEEEVQDGEDAIDAFYDQIKENDFINLLMKDRSQEITENLYLDTGKMNPAFGVPKGKMEREDLVNHVYGKLDELFSQYKGLEETSFFNEFKKSIRNALRANLGGTASERKEDDINKILLGYLVIYENESRQVVPKYLEIVGDEENKGKVVERVTAKTNTPSSRYEDDRRDLAELLSVEEKPLFSEFFRFFDRMEKKPEMAKLKTDQIDSLFMTFDLGKARRRNEIYNFWQEYEKEDDEWSKFVDMFGKNGTVFEMIEKLEYVDKDDETKKIRELLKGIIDNSFIEQDNKPVIKVKPIEFKVNPMFVKLNVVEQLFGSLVKDAETLGIRFTDVEVLDQIDNFDPAGYRSEKAREEMDEMAIAEEQARMMDQDMTAETTYDKEGRRGADQAVYENVIMPTPEFDAIEEERKKLLEILENIGDLKEVEVDPIFYYLTENNVKFKNLGVTRRYAKILEKSLKRKRRKILTKKTIYDIKDSSLDKLDDIIDDMLEEAAREPREEYTMPMTDKVIELLKGLPKSSEIDLDKGFLKRFKKLKDFCKALMKALQEGRSTLQEGGSSIVRETTRQGRQVGRTFAGQRQGKSPLIDIEGDTEEIQDMYSEMLFTVYTSLIAPFESTYMPFDEDNPFFSDREVKIIKEDMISLKDVSIDDANDFIRQAMIKDDSILDYDSAKGLVSFLEQLTKVGTKDKSDLIDATVRVNNAIGDIFEDRFNDENKKYLGKFLADISEKNDLGDITFLGDDVNDLAKEYDDSPASSYPIPALIKHITQKKNEYEADSSFEDDSGKNIISEKILPMLEELRKEVRKSEIELAILHAHDVIRKKLNKPVYYSHGDIDDPDHVEIVNKMVYDQYRIDLSASEIRKIDDEFGAFGEIAKDNGVSEDIVYIIKSNFR
tara:strand:- start:845 stop:3628 length:2784 start_codon:yes stop_codon:yes gene_type:complete